MEVAVVSRPVTLCEPAICSRPTAHSWPCHYGTRTVLACSSSRTDREKRACVDFCGLRSVASPFAPRAGSQLRHLHFRRPCSTRRRAGRRADGCWRVRRVGGLDMSNDRELKKHLKDEHDSEVEEQELAGTAFAPCPVPGCETIHSLKGGSVGVTPRGHALLSPPPTVLHQTRAGRSRGPPQAHAIRRRRSLVWGAFTLHRGCSHHPQKPSVRSHGRAPRVCWSI